MSGMAKERIGQWNRDYYQASNFRRGHAQTDQCPNEQEKLDLICRYVALGGALISL